MNRIILFLIRSLMRYYARREWKLVITHIKTCTHSPCKWYNVHGLPEDQDETIFCYKGNKLWSRHWDLSHLAETYPQ